jgi:hypothetical protein
MPKLQIPDYFSKCCIEVGDWKITPSKKEFIFLPNPADHKPSSTLSPANVHFEILRVVDD